MSLRRELQRLERKRSLPFHHAPIWPVLRRSQLTLDFHSDEHPVCLERFCPPPPRWRKIPLPIPSLSLSPPSTTTTSRKSSSPTAPLPLHASARPQPLPPSLLRHSQRLQSSREAITIHMEELVEGERSEGISEGYRARVQEGIKGRTAAGRTRSLPATQAMGRAEEEIAGSTFLRTETPRARLWEEAAAATASNGTDPPPRPPPASPPPNETARSPRHPIPHHPLPKSLKRAPSSRSNPPSPKDLPPWQRPLIIQASTAPSLLPASSLPSLNPPRAIIPPSETRSREQRAAVPGWTRPEEAEGTLSHLARACKLSAQEEVPPRGREVVHREEGEAGTLQATLGTLITRRPPPPATTSPSLDLLQLPLLLYLPPPAVILPRRTVNISPLSPSHLSPTRLPPSAFPLRPLHPNTPSTFSSLSSMHIRHIILQCSSRRRAIPSVRRHR
jgi:hypothetical protein